MLQGLIASLFFSGLYLLLTRSIRKKIAQAETVEEAVYLRGKIKGFRLLVLLLFVVFVFLLCYFFKLQKSKNTISYGNDFLWIIQSIGIIASTLIVTKIAPFNLPVSINTVNDVHLPYSLLLRAFERDLYKYNEKPSTSKGRFNEHALVRSLRSRVLLYAIGMTKDIESPQGAERIYLNDDTWQQDVFRLMQKSTSIIVIISNRKSCLWEIEQTTQMLKKTIFVVDDIDEYNQVRTKMKGIIDFPEISKAKKPRIVFFYLNHGRVYTYDFSGKNVKSYNHLAEIITYFSPYSRKRALQHSAIDIINRYN